MLYKPQDLLNSHTISDFFLTLWQMTLRCHHYISQNGRGQRGPLEVIMSNPLLKQGHLQPLALDHAQTTSEHLQGWRCE